MPERAMIKVVRKARGSTVMFFQTRLARVFNQSTTAMMMTGYFDLLVLKSLLPEIHPGVRGRALVQFTFMFHLSRPRSGHPVHWLMY